jgi:hypothetical protein
MAAITRRHQACSGYAGISRRSNAACGIHASDVSCRITTLIVSSWPLTSATWASVGGIARGCSRANCEGARVGSSRC